MTVKGLDKHVKRLQNMRKAARQVTGALYAAGQDIELDAERSITEGSVSGAGHVPSLPGQPPNRDTGHLDTNIETTVEAQNPPTVHVTSHAEYSAALEYGTSKMAERPFMRPATEKNRKNVSSKVAETVRVTIRRG
ncbi:HK97-gp10 family putative phage morphogenesis protein [Brucella intermedia]|uniref:Phage protein, HK97, gp10 n=1 Tax=Brucella intermedia M86 TaxID=1234597 RepID=M5JKG9_9HYPH|nr:HK97-gp10 family putative phage morphogenesis protein [Brucella intermedia]ELT46843.1 Phage protein, HK97, gp10 [Brucella intermedia M86]